MMSDNMMYFLLFIVTKIHVNTVDEKNTSCFNLFTQPYKHNCVVPQLFTWRSETVWRQLRYIVTCFQNCEQSLACLTPIVASFIWHRTISLQPQPENSVSSVRHCAWQHEKEKTPRPTDLFTRAERNTRYSDTVRHTMRIFILTTALFLCSLSKYCHL